MTHIDGTTFASQLMAEPIPVLTPEVKASALAYVRRHTDATATQEVLEMLGLLDATE